MITRHPTRAGLIVLVAVMLGVPAQHDLNRPFGALDLPGIAETQPLVGLFHLPAVDDVLIEDAELIANPVAQRRDLQGSHGIEKTGRETPQTAIAEAGFFFLTQQFQKIQSQFLDRLARLVVDAEVDEIVAEMSAEQEFGGQVADRAGALFGVGGGGADPAVQEPIADRVGQSEVVVVHGRQGRKLALAEEQMIQKRALDDVFVQPGAFVFGEGIQLRLGHPIHAHSRRSCARSRRGYRETRCNSGAVALRKCDARR